MQKIFMLIIISALLAGSCTNHNKQTLIGDICDTTNTKFSSFVNPTIVSHCLSCHNNSSASGGISLEGYDNVKAHYASCLASMKSGTMPSGAAPLDFCTIVKFETWINKGANNN